MLETKTYPLYNWFWPAWTILTINNCYNPSLVHMIEVMVLFSICPSGKHLCLKPNFLICSPTFGLLWSCQCSWILPSAYRRSINDLFCLIGGALRSRRTFRPSSWRASINDVIVSGRARHAMGLRSCCSRSSRKFCQKSFGIPSRRNSQLARVSLRFPRRTTGGVFR